MKIQTFFLKSTILIIWNSSTRLTNPSKLNTVPPFVHQRFVSGCSTQRLLRPGVLSTHGQLWS